jgi:hypothetical protein
MLRFLRIRSETRYIKNVNTNERKNEVKSYNFSIKSNFKSKLSIFWCKYNTMLALSRLGMQSLF